MKLAFAITAVVLAGCAQPGPGDNVVFVDGTTSSTYDPCANPDNRPSARCGDGSKPASSCQGSEPTLAASSPVERTVYVTYQAGAQTYAGSCLRVWFNDVECSSHGIEAFGPGQTAAFDWTEAGCGGELRSGARVAVRFDVDDVTVLRATVTVR